MLINIYYSKISKKLDLLEHHKTLLDGKSDYLQQNVALHSVILYHGLERYPVCG